MHILLPKWLRHAPPSTRPTHGDGVGAVPEAAPIFSCDVQPQGKRLATAGQDAAVSLWSVEALAQLALADGAQGGSEVVPNGALLARITGHSRSCNCVRWSPGGVLLASGGDDATVLVYERRGEGGRSAAFGGGGEDWMVRKPLRGHDADVTDVCWSPDGEKIASASVDNTIGVWDVRAAVMVTRLTGHHGLVKGVAWDPVGRFLASQSDDRSLLVWRASDWGVDKKLSQPFKGAVYKANSNVYFLRCSWSPCGSSLLGVNALKEPHADIAPMFTRTSGFDDFIDLVGHTQPVISSRFSPRLYRKKTPPGAKPGLPYTCLAIGSKDGEVTIWQARAKRPFVVLSNAFSQDVIDLTWASDGYSFVACCSSGHVLYARFSDDELGEVVPYEEERELLAKSWRDFGGGADATSGPPESAQQFALQERAKAKDLEGASEINSIAKRGWKPVHANHMVVADPVVQVVSSVPSASAAGAVGGATTGRGAAAVGGQERSAAAPTFANAVAPTPPADDRLMASQKEMRDRGGKRRIIPAAVGKVEVRSGGEAAPVVQGEGLVFAGRQAQPPPVKRVRIEGGQDVAANGGGGAWTGGMSNGGSGSLVVPNGPFTVQQSNCRNFGGGARSEGHAGAVLAPCPPLCKPSVVGLSMLLLPGRTDSVGSSLVRAIDTSMPPTMLEAAEQHGSSSGGGHMVSCARGSTVLWRDYYPPRSVVAMLAGVSKKFAAVGTADGLLFFYSAATGRRLMPPIVLDSAPHLLEAFVVGDTWFSLVVSRSGLCSVFNIVTKKLVCARSAAPLLARPVNAKGETPDGDSGISRADVFRSIAVGRVTDAGEPLLILSDSHAFFYSKDLCSWLRVADDAAPNSEFTRGATSPPVAAGLVRSLQASAASSRRAPTLSGMGDLRRSAIETLTHLETLLESAVSLRSPCDYKYYLSCYAAKLATAASDDVESSDARLRELCDMLLCVKGNPEDLHLLGMDRRHLLKDVVMPVLGGDPSMQRLVSEYTESLEALSKE